MANMEKILIVDDGMDIASQKMMLEEKGSKIAMFKICSANLLFGFI